MTQFAIDLNFEFLEIKELRIQNLDVKIIKNFLRQTRSTKFYNLTNEFYESFMKSICRILNEIKKHNKNKFVNIKKLDNNDIVIDYHCERSYILSHTRLKKICFTKYSSNTTNSQRSFQYSS